MLFNSITFLFFFVVVVSAYYALPHRFRWILLLLASYFFYMSWKVEYGILLLISTTTVYFSAIQISKTQNTARRKAYLGASLLINLGILFTFKYFNFALGSLADTLRWLEFDYTSPTLELLLPIGISFYTFQALSYLLDVYKGDKEAERHFGIFAVFISYFPQLVAGPIERSSHLLPQFHEEKVFNYDAATSGLKLMAWGFFKKVVIADNVAVLVNQVYNQPTEYTGLPLIIATFGFAIQVYCDFSGYTDIARGNARVMGFDLMKNFNRPYSARSLSDFWRRWHISLSSWLNDYVYTPLVINKRNWGLMGVMFALIMTFFISGLWHGAAWTFVLWGILHGIGLAIEVLSKKKRKKFRKAIHPLIYGSVSLVVVFLFVNFTYIFFRANSIDDAFYIVSHLFTGLPAQLLPSNLNYMFNTGIVEVFAITKIELIIILSSIFLMESVQLLHEKKNMHVITAKMPAIARYFVYIIVIDFIVLFGKYGRQEFIYFQF